MFHTARPIGGGVRRSDGASGSLMVAQTVVSVGPYALIILRSRDHRSTSAAEHASPATVSTMPAGSPSSSRAASAAGEIVACVMRCRAITPARPDRPAPGSSRSAGARTSVEPDSSARHSSEKAASKLGEATWRIRLPSSTANRSIWLPARLATPRCVTTTPFGRPVEPEV